MAETQPAETVDAPSGPMRGGRIARAFAWIVLCLMILAGVVSTAFHVSPWPGVMVIRYVFQRGGEAFARGLEPYVPPGVNLVSDLRYDPSDRRALLDVYTPPGVSEGETLPTVVWTHGGGFVAGSKEEIGNYLRIVANEGYAVVAVAYTRAPEATFPTPVVQVNAALGYLADNAQKLHVDASRIVLAGDSAGAQISAQLANVLTAPAYAAEMGIEPLLPAGALRGMVLFCGAYDLALVDPDGPFGWFLNTVLWAYTGTRDFMNDPRFENFSIARDVTSAFPPAFISAGNGDPLLQHSLDMAAALKKQGVAVDALFFPEDHEPKLGHEYQFVLDDAGRLALARMLAFLTERTK
jgi:acetyl esterase